MDPSGQRFTYKATRQARPQTMTMVAYDTTILPSGNSEESHLDTVTEQPVVEWH